MTNFQNIQKINLFYFNFCNRYKKLLIFKIFKKLTYFILIFVIDTKNN